MEMKQGDYVLGFWFGPQIDGEGSSDFLMTALRRDGEWHIEYRFRYHVDKKTMDSDDKKNFYGYKLKETSEETVMAMLTEMVEHPVMTSKYKVEFHEVKGDMDKWMYVMAQQPWASIKRVKAE